MCLFGITFIISLLSSNAKAVGPISSNAKAVDPISSNAVGPISSNATKAAGSNATNDSVVACVGSLPVLAIVLVFSFKTP